MYYSGSVDVAPDNLMIFLAITCRWRWIESVFNVGQGVSDCEGHGWVHWVRRFKSCQCERCLRSYIGEDELYVVFKVQVLELLFDDGSGRCVNVVDAREVEYDQRELLSTVECRIVINIMGRLTFGGVHRSRRLGLRF